MRRKVRLRPAAWLAAALLAAGMWAAAGCAQKGVPPKTQPAPQPAPGPAPLSAAAREGGKLYLAYACVYCHGVGGTGGVPNPFNEGGDATVPPLVGAGFQRDYGTDQAVAAILKSGSILNSGKATSMPSWNGILNDQQTANLTAYIRAGLPDTGEAPPATRSGTDVYDAYACGKCHGPIGRGGVANVAATDAGDKEIPALGTPAFHREFDTDAKIRGFIINGSVIEQGKASVVFMPRWGDVIKAAQAELVTGWLRTYK